MLILTEEPHYMGYAVTHDVDLADRNKLSFMLWAAQDAVGWNEKTVFHPYYAEKPAVTTFPRHDRQGSAPWICSASLCPAEMKT